MKKSGIIDLSISIDVGSLKAIMILIMVFRVSYRTTRTGRLHIHHSTTDACFINAAFCGINCDYYISKYVELSLRPCSHHSFETGTVPERNRAPVFTPVPLRAVVPERADHLAM